MDRQHCKVFVGGLNWETTDEKLRRYFENYGTVLEAFVSYDRVTMKPRGFGFVVFEDPAVADKVVKLQHTIDRREVEAKKAVPKDEGTTKPMVPGLQVGARTRKCFVGGLPANVQEQTLRTYFEQFGQVDDAVVMYDHDNKRPRGFGFVTFASEDSVERCLAQGHLQLLQDKQIEVKRAVPKDQMQQATAAVVQQQQQQQQQTAATPTVAAPSPRPFMPQANQYNLAAAQGYATLLQQQQQQQQNATLQLPSMGSAAQSFTSLGQPSLTQQQLLALQQQQQGKVHSSAVAAQLGMLTNTMTGVVGGAPTNSPAWVAMAGHSAPAGPTGGLPGAYPHAVAGPINLGALQPAAPPYASIAAPDGGFNSQLVWELSSGGGLAQGVPQMGALQQHNAMLSGGAQHPQQQMNLWNATTAAVMGAGAAPPTSLPLVQNGSSSNSSYLEVPLNFP